MGTKRFRSAGVFSLRKQSTFPFAIKACQLDSGKIVGHLPMELSRISKFILDRGAKIEVKLRETHYRRSPLVQGGLEVPCDLVIRMPNTMKSAELLKKYLKLFENCFEEPQEIVILVTLVVNLLKTSEEMRKIILLEERRQPHLSQIQNQPEKKK